METFEINVEGMTCDHCVKQVGSVIRDLDCVHDYSIDLEAGKVELLPNTTEVRDAVVNAINKTDIFKAA